MIYFGSGFSQTLHNLAKPARSSQDDETLTVKKRQQKQRKM
uniref:Uncharacterized protein n=1 Tax=Arundo donax TaxID=35708 RepID=A0A0A9CFS8_ARUDO